MELEQIRRARRQRNRASPRSPSADRHGPLTAGNSQSSPVQQSRLRASAEKHCRVNSERCHLKQNSFQRTPPIAQLDQPRVSGYRLDALDRETPFINPARYHSNRFDEPRAPERKPPASGCDGRNRVAGSDPPRAAAFPTPFKAFGVLLFGLLNQ